ncbi:MAG: helix-turn-helix transcriptional regulator [Candidatus Natronoplasma sp.]
MVADRKNRIKLDGTKGEILENLLSTDLTALELSDILSINESAVRRHLNNLESDGLVESYFEKADKGRPKKYFTLTDGGKKTFPRQIELLLELIIRNIKEEFDEDVSSSLKEKLVNDLIGLFPEVDEDEILERKIEKVVEGSNEMGFYTSYSEEDGSHHLSFRNCAFGDLPKEEARWLCEAHKKVIEELLGGVELQQKSSMVEGDHTCIQRISD